MYYVCLRYLGNADDARDIMHDAFVKVFASIAKFRAEASIETWISRIMANTSISQIRKEAKKNFVKDIDDVQVADTEDTTGVFDVEKADVTADEVLELIQKLPTGYRVVLSMYALDGFTHKEIADKLGISEGTSKSQLAKARKMLKKQLAKKNEPE